MPRLNGKQQEQALEIYRIIRESPGIATGHLALRLGVEHKRVHPMLVSLETYRFLVSEDERGRLYPFDPDMWG